LYTQDIPWNEYEIICVDDCSPDGSRAIVERLQKEYPTLQLLTTPENLRQGGARNVALDVAKGKYIWFIDSDDYIQTNCLAALLKQAEEEDLDILDFDFTADAAQHYRKNEKPFDLGPCTGADYVFDQQYGGSWSWRCSCVWGGLMTRTLIGDLRFREKVQFEDNDFALLLYARAKRVHHIPAKPYYYRVVDNSTVHKAVTLQQVKYNLELLKTYINIHQTEDMDVRFKNGVVELMKYVAHQVLLLLGQITQEERVEFYRQKLGHISALRPYLGKKVWWALQSDCIRKLIAK
jgi:glycosyltransferase involved in cell wall biosynthesis